MRTPAHLPGCVCDRRAYRLTILLHCAHHDLTAILKLESQIPVMIHGYIINDVQP